MNTFYISDEALEFYRQLKIPERKMSEYFYNLSKAKFKDTRPDEFKASDVERLKYNLYPYWGLSNVRIPRKYSMTYDTISGLANIARIYFINKEEARPRLHTEKLTDVALTSLVIEAVGLGYLTAITVVEIPKLKLITIKRKNYPSCNPKSIKEFSW